MDQKREAAQKLIAEMEPKMVAQKRSCSSNNKKICIPREICPKCKKYVDDLVEHKEQKRCGKCEKCGKKTTDLKKHIR